MPFHQNSLFRTFWGLIPFFLGPSVFANLTVVFETIGSNEAVLNVKSSVDSSSMKKFRLKKVENSSCVDFSQKKEVTFRVCQDDVGYTISGNVDPSSQGAWREISPSHRKESEKEILWENADGSRTVHKKIDRNGIMFLDENKVIAKVDLKKAHPELQVFNSQTLKSFPLSFWASLWSPFLLVNPDLESEKVRSLPVLSDDVVSEFSSRSSVSTPAVSSLSSPGGQIAALGAVAVFSAGCYFVYRSSKEKGEKPFHQVIQEGPVFIGNEILLSRADIMNKLIPILRDEPHFDVKRGSKIRMSLNRWIPLSPREWKSFRESSLFWKDGKAWKAEGRVFLDNASEQTPYTVSILITPGRMGVAFTKGSYTYVTNFDINFESEGEEFLMIIRQALETPWIYQGSDDSLYES